VTTSTCDAGQQDEALLRLQEVDARGWTHLHDG
jgi:hypothetical protein